MCSYFIWCFLQKKSQLETGTHTPTLTLTIRNQQFYSLEILVQKRPYPRLQQPQDEVMWTKRWVLGLPQLCPPPTTSRLLSRSPSLWRRSCKRNAAQVCTCILHNYFAILLQHSNKSYVNSFFLLLSLILVPSKLRLGRLSRDWSTKQILMAVVPVLFLFNRFVIQDPRQMLRMDL